MGTVLESLVLLPTAEDLCHWLRWPHLDGDQAVEAQQHIETATTLVRAYVRGRGFMEIDGVQHVDQALRSVILSAAGRSLSNPTSASRIEAGSYSESPGAPGWSLMERVILDGFRRRAA